MIMNPHCVLLVLCLVVLGAQGHSRGAPTVMMPINNECTTGDLRPGHTTPYGNGSKVAVFPRSDRNPFRLVVENPNVRYGPGGPKIRVTLKTTNPARKFKGFLISVDATDAKMGCKGQFQVSPKNRGLARRVVYCYEAITHVNPNPKSEVTVLWTPPANFTHGRIQFKATVVENYRTFYTGVRSQPVNPDPSVDTESVFDQKKLGPGFGGGSGNVIDNIMQQMMQSMNLGGGQPSGGGGGGGALSNMMDQVIRNMRPPTNQPGGRQSGRAGPTFTRNGPGGAPAARG